MAIFGRAFPIHPWISKAPPSGAAPSNTPPGWWQGVSPEVFRSTAVSPAQQQFSSFQPQGFIASTFPDGWRGAQYDYRFAKPFPAAEQQHSAFQAAGFIASIFPDGWRKPEWEWCSAKAFPAGEQQFSGHVAERVPSALDAQGWNGQQLDARFAKPVPASTQQWGAAFQQQGTIVSITPQGWWPVNPEAFGKGFPAREQQWSAFQPQGAIADAPNSPPGWWQSLNPEIFTRPLGAWQQQYLALGLRNIISTTPQGWPFQWPDAFNRPDRDFPFASMGSPAAGVPTGWTFQSPGAFNLPNREMPFSPPVGTLPTPTAVATPGWEGQQYGYLFGKPFGVALQQFAGIFVGKPLSPEGWHGWQLNIAFGAAFPVKAQQFIALTPPRVADPSNTTTWRQQPVSPELFAKLFPAAVQQYEARGIIIPPAPETTNLPGHGDWPRHVKKPKVRPVWDRRPDPLPQTKEDPPPEEGAPEHLPSTAKAPHDGKDWPYITRVLVPTAEPEVAAPKAQQRPRRVVTARAEIADLDIAEATATAAALPASIAHISLAEADDTLIATATWNDDEIALGLLLGELGNE